MCWNRVSVTEFKFTMNDWRTDRLLWKETQGYEWWLRRLKPGVSWLLSGSATQPRPAAPWHDIIWWKLSPLMKRRWREGPINNWSKIKWQILTHVRSQTNKTRASVHKYTLTHARTNTTQTEGQFETQSVSQSRASRPLCGSAGTVQKPLD